MKYLIVLALLATMAKAEPHPVISLSGSGTTNPSKCYWKIMGKISERCRTPLWMSYRAVGSGNGIEEFLGVNHTSSFSFKPHNQFGSGDIPIPQADYDAFKTYHPTKKIYHLPVVMGAISFFHSIPNVEDGSSGLNMTACSLAKVFKREIKFWDDEEILKDNEGLRKSLAGEKLPITVSVRTNGSSSTSSITKYLREACPDHWPAGMVGKLITWNADVSGVEGSAQMTANIRRVKGTIGYIDAGHGHAENLVEIELKNKDGKFLSSKYAMANQGIQSAGASLPDDLSESFADVTFINKPGPNTWPIVAMSYIYIRGDLNEIDLFDKYSLALLKAFLKSLYRDDYIKECDEFRFARIPEAAKVNALAVIENLPRLEGEPEFLFETSEDTQVFIGQGPYVISSKIRRYSDIQISSQSSDVKEIENRANANAAKIVVLDNSIGVESNTTTPQVVKGKLYTDADSDRVTAALTLASISIALWTITLFVVGAKRLCGL